MQIIKIFVWCTLENFLYYRVFRLICRFDKHVTKYLVLFMQTTFICLYSHFDAF